jgi:N-acetyl-gamma-glutamyl-phosphate reductase
MIRAGIVGASGYTGETLLRLLLDHSLVELAYIGSRQWDGKLVGEAIAALAPLKSSLRFSNLNPEQLAQQKLDVVFLALPHGVAAEYALPLATAGIRVIDLSADFRLNSAITYRQYYNHEHPAPEWLANTPYLLPEWNAFLLQEKQQGGLVAAPGCYPTSILLPLLPLLKAGLVSTSGIIVNSYSGISGAGKKLAEDYLYVERSESMKAYGLPVHRHLSEIEEQLTLAAGEEVVVQFHPHLAPVRRGIHTTISVPFKGVGIEQVYDCWQTLYGKQPFIHILPSGQFPDTAHYVGTNLAGFSAVWNQRTGNLIITSAIDNLMKGAASQAIQIMNLWFGFAETAGLAGKTLSGV